MFYKLENSQVIFMWSLLLNNCIYSLKKDNSFTEEGKNSIGSYIDQILSVYLKFLPSNLLNKTNADVTMDQINYMNLITSILC